MPTASPTLRKTIKGLAKNVTLYVASNDRALIVSRNFWGSYRAGDVPPAGPLILPGIDTIDVTAASTDTFAINHSGYASNNKLLEDIGELLRTGLRPPEMRSLKPGKITGPGGDYWRYVPCATGSLTPQCCARSPARGGEAKGIIYPALRDLPPSVDPRSA